jgi:hypothetical protein
MLHGKELLQMNPYTAQNETKSQRTQPSSSTGKMPRILIQSQTNNKNQDTISFKTILQNKSYSGSKSNTNHHYQYLGFQGIQQLLAYVELQIRLHLMGLLFQLLKVKM